MEDFLHPQYRVISIWNHYKTHCVHSETNWKVRILTFWGWIVKYLVLQGGIKADHHFEIYSSGPLIIFAFFKCQYSISRDMKNIYCQKYPIRRLHSVLIINVWHNNLILKKWFLPPPTSPSNNGCVWQLLMMKLSKLHFYGINLSGNLANNVSKDTWMCPVIHKYWCSN